MNKLLIDIVVGGVVCGIISYSSNILGKSENYYKVLAFLWALPITLPFMLGIVNKGSIKNGMIPKESAYKFFRHSAAGFGIGLMLTLIGLHLITKYELPLIINTYWIVLGLILGVYFMTSL